MKLTLRTSIQHRLKCSCLLALFITLQTCLAAAAESEINKVTQDGYEYLLFTPDKETGFVGLSDITQPYALLNRIVVTDENPYKPDYVVLTDFVEKDGLRYEVRGFSTEFWSNEYQVRYVTLNTLTPNTTQNLNTDYVWGLSESPNPGWLSYKFPFGVFFNSLQSFYPAYARRDNVDAINFQYMPHLGSIMFPAQQEYCEFKDYRWDNKTGSSLRQVGFGFKCKSIDFGNLPYFNILKMEQYGLYEGLSSIKCSSPYPPTIIGLDFDNLNSELKTHVTVHVPIGCYDAYANAEGWSNFTNIVADLDYAYNQYSEWTIVDDVIYGYSYDAEKEENSAIVIGPVDRNTSNSIYIHDEVNINGRTCPVTKIGECAFMDCENIVNVNIDAYHLKEIGDMAFYQWSHPSKFESIRYIDDCLERIGHYAFCGTYLSEWSLGPLPNSLKFIGNYAFSGYHKFTSYYPPIRTTILLNEGLEHIGHFAFEDFPVEYSLVIPSTVSYIGQRAFSGFSSFNYDLKHIEFRNSSTNKALQNTSYGAFYCALNPNATFEYPESTECVSYHDGINCKNVVIPENVKYILPNAFEIKKGEDGQSQEIWFKGETLPTIWATSFKSQYNNEDPDFGVILHTKKNVKYRCPEDAAIWSKFYNIVTDVQDDNDETPLTDGNWTFVINPVTGKAIITGFDNSSITNVSSDMDFEIPETLSSNGVSYKVESIRKWAISEVGKNPYDTDVYYRVNLILPASIESIEDYAITYTSMYNVHCKAMTPPAVESEYTFPLMYPWLGDYLTNGKLYVPEGTKELYEESNFGKMFNAIEEETFSGIESISSEEADIDAALPVEVFNPAGICVYSGVYSNAELPKGVYVVRQGEKSKKVMVK